MTSPLDEAMRDFAVEQLEKEAKGEHTYLDDMPNDEFMAKEAHFYIKMANKGLNVKANRAIAKTMLQISLKYLERKKDES
jgi:hypothetical protein